MQKNSEYVIVIRIGDEDTVLFHARVTDAPPVYDGFGTFTVAEWSGEGKNEARLVLIRDEHFEWQTHRYASGMHTPTLPEYFNRKAIAEVLWHRITGYINK
jgi:hypothetical protein